MLCKNYILHFQGHDHRPSRKLTSLSRSCCSVLRFASSSYSLSRSYHRASCSSCSLRALSLDSCRSFNSWAAASGSRGGISSSSCLRFSASATRCFCRFCFLASLRFSLLVSIVSVWHELWTEAKHLPTDIVHFGPNTSPELAGAIVGGSPPAPLITVGLRTESIGRAGACEERCDSIER